ncbi:hypothetical protein [Phycicoccus sp. HDW14]|uniref:hypothetical protein n=1 Tax=Phycicoccus sp. HDW14 TaxID=2714941 RepID=UPI001F0D6255|nr:hypothetical protein [Phycicoccus sp. HDW14]
MVAVTGAVALAASALTATTATASGAATTTAATTARTGYAVLAADGTDARALAQRLTKAGATVTSVNTAIGLVSVESTKGGFAATARSLPGVAAAARDGVVGHSPDAAPRRTRWPARTGRPPATVTTRVTGRRATGPRAPRPTPSTPTSGA